MTFNYLDYAPLLLICLPKNLHPKKTDTELSEAELRKRRVQILDRKHDLRFYKSKLRGQFFKNVISKIMLIYLKKIRSMFVMTLK